MDKACCLICGSVVINDDLDRRVGLVKNRTHRAFDKRRRVIGGDQDMDGRTRREYQRSRKWVLSIIGRFIRADQWGWDPKRLLTEG